MLSLALVCKVLIIPSTSPPRAASRDICCDDQSERVGEGEEELKPPTSS